MEITINFSELRFKFCLWRPKSIKKYFPGHFIQSWRKFKDFSTTSTKFKDLSKKNGIQGLFKTVRTLLFLTSHFAVKQIVESKNVGSFLRLTWHLLSYRMGMNTGETEGELLELLCCYVAWLPTCESCCWNPLNLGAYLPIVHYKKKIKFAFIIILNRLQNKY